MSRLDAEEPELNAIRPGTNGIHNHHAHRPGVAAACSQQRVAARQAALLTGGWRATPGQADPGGLPPVEADRQDRTTLWTKPKQHRDDERAWWPSRSCRRQVGAEPRGRCSPGGDALPVCCAKPWDRSDRRSSARDVCPGSCTHAIADLEAWTTAGRMVRPGALPPDIMAGPTTGPIWINLADLEPTRRHFAFTDAARVVAIDIQSTGTVDHQQYLKDEARAGESWSCICFRSRSWRRWDATSTSWYRPAFASPWQIPQGRA